MKRFLLLSVLAFNVLFAFAQITIKGKIIDCETKEHLKRARVSFVTYFHIIGWGSTVDTRYWIPVDQYGNFEFEYQRLKNDSAKISYLGYSHEDSSKTKIEFFLPSRYEISIWSEDHPLRGNGYYDSETYDRVDDIFLVNLNIVDGDGFNIDLTTFLFLEYGEVNVEICLQINKRPDQYRVPT